MIPGDVHRVPLRLPERHADLRAWVVDARWRGRCTVWVEHPESGCHARVHGVIETPHRIGEALVTAVKLCRARVRMLGTADVDVQTLDATTLDGAEALGTMLEGELPTLRAAEPIRP